MQKKRLLHLLIGIYLLISAIPVSATVMQNQPDSVWLFSYASVANHNKGGLHFAWSGDSTNWKSIGPDFGFLSCDYGAWGREKRMINPYLFKDSKGKWNCIWTVNEREGVFARTVSSDLTNWVPQQYPVMDSAMTCLNLKVIEDTESGEYVVSWESTGKKSGTFETRTKDFREFSPIKKVNSSVASLPRETIKIGGKLQTGICQRVPMEVVEHLVHTREIDAYRQNLWNEQAKDDSSRFKGLKTINADLVIDTAGTKRISNHLIGVFFEDINYAADGGLYAEMIQNRDFEYTPADHHGWNSKTAWTTMGKGTEFSIAVKNPIHPNNPHYAKLKLTASEGGLENSGYDGLAFEKGKKYRVSLFARIPGKEKGSVKVELKDEGGELVGNLLFSDINSTWKKYELQFEAKTTTNKGSLEIIPQDNSVYDLDMISLFPVDTYKGHKNGLRKDLAETIAAIHPKFVRFPGGCVSHGDGLNNIYKWKNTIGPLEARKPQFNLWNYHQSAGLGYFEYFQFCEDIGAEPVPVVAAGVCCQNSHTGGAGQQGGIPMSQMDDYIQDILDLIEYANGPATSKWGKIRAESGHPEPFHLKYLGVGNEDLISNIFKDRFKMIYNAVKSKYPDITVIGTVGPYFEGSDYNEGWKFASQLHVPMVDEHYYQSPGWFIHNQNFYDQYDRKKPAVYLGEYAAQLPGRPNNIETALSEAIYLTGVERNGDIVRMASYAPLLAREKHTRWRPDLIYFNQSEVKTTVDYYVQKMYGQNSGDQYFPSELTLSDSQSEVKCRVGVSVVKDSNTGDYIVKLVNLLPVAVKMNLDASSLNLKKGVGKLIILQGQPADHKATPSESQIVVDHTFDYELHPYSFSVIRIKAN